MFAELERSMINTRTKVGIEQAKKKGVKFGRRIGSKNKNTEYKLERIKIFLKAGKSYNWIANELSVSKETIAAVKNSEVRGGPKWLDSFAAKLRINSMV